MQSPEQRDYFSDLSILKDPYEYFEEIRARGPVCRLADRDVVVVTVNRTLAIRAAVR